MRSAIVCLVSGILIGCSSSFAAPTSSSVEKPPGEDGTPPIAAVEVKLSTSACPSDMVEVKGDYCPSVEEVCLKWVDSHRLRCAEFVRPTKCLSQYRTHMHYCMSTFEYPGKEGTYPLVGVDYYQAKKLAADEGYRLCTKDEFNFACEGEDIRPYGYGDGYTRDDGSLGCNIDKPWIDYHPFPSSSWNDPTAGLNQSIVSDRSNQCKSVFGIYNLNGNVDEILNSEKHKNVVLSGGYWGPIRARCRPTTDAHGKLFSFYQVGFRTCSDTR